MATRSIPVLGFGTNPRADVWWEPFQIAATNDVWKRGVFRFKDTSTRLGLDFGFPVPKDYVTNGKFKVRWTATATTGNVAWDVDYRTVAGDDANSLDQAGTEESVTVTDAAPTAALRQLEATITPTAANFAAGEEVEATLFRDGADGADTMAADALLFELSFEYDDI